MLKKTLYIYFIFLSFVVNAQIPKEDISADISVFPTEKVALTINTNVLLAGELLQYKAFNLNADSKASRLSKVLYVSLRNENDSIIFSNKLKVEKGVANGDFFIPSTLKTGIYRLIGYTNFSRNNQQDAYDEKNIYILNTFVKTDEIKKIADTVSVNFNFKNEMALSEEKNNTKSILITSNKKTYGFREEVTINLENTLNSSGNYALSVRKISPVTISNKTSKISKNIASEMFYLPELRGELITGVLLSNEDNLPVTNKGVSLTIPGKDFVFKIAKTNSDGRFFFSVAEGYTAEKSIIQLYTSEENAKNYTLVLDKKDFVLGKSNPTVLKLNPNLKDWLQERSVQLQVENAYFDTKKDSILSHKINPTFYNNLGTLFLLDDYTRFPTVRETLIEVVTLAAVRGSGANSRFIVNNEYDPNGIAKFNDIPPLVLMDGMLIQNNEDVLNYNAREIESIRVVAKPYRYGSKIYSGIIAVETKKGDFIPTLSKNHVEQLDLAPAASRKKLYYTDYSEKATLSRIPDYRVQLLWQPNLSLSGKGFNASFFTSDVGGTYNVHLEGFSEQGKFISVDEYFQVN